MFDSKEINWAKNNSVKMRLLINYNQTDYEK